MAVAMSVQHHDGQWNMSVPVFAKSANKSARCERPILVGPTADAVSG